MATNRNQERLGWERAGGRERVTRQGEGEVKRRTEQVGRGARGMGQKMKNRAGDMVESRKHQAADRIHDVGDRLETRGQAMEAQGGVKGKAGQIVHGTGERIERGADYIEERRVGEIRNDAKDQIQDHPFATVGAALGTGFALGWVTGKVRGSDREERGRFEGGAAEREEEGRGTAGRLGRTLLTGATTMAARGIRRRIAGEPRRA